MNSHRLPTWTYAAALAGLGLFHALSSVGCSGNGDTTIAILTNTPKQEATRTFTSEPTAGITSEPTSSESSASPEPAATLENRINSIMLKNDGNAATENSTLTVYMDGTIKHTFYEPEGGFPGALRGKEKIGTGRLPEEEILRLYRLIENVGFSQLNGDYGSSSGHWRDVSVDIGGIAYPITIIGGLNQTENPESSQTEKVPDPLRILIEYLESGDGPAVYATDLTETGRMYDATVQ